MKSEVERGERSFRFFLNLVVELLIGAGRTRSTPLCLKGSPRIVRSATILETALILTTGFETQRLNVASP